MSVLVLVVFFYCSWTSWSIKPRQDVHSHHDRWHFRRNKCLLPQRIKSHAAPYKGTSKHHSSLTLTPYRPVVQKLTHIVPRSLSLKNTVPRHFLRIFGCVTFVLTAASPTHRPPQRLSTPSAPSPFALMQDSTNQTGASPTCRVLPSPDEGFGSAGAR